MTRTTWRPKARSVGYFLAVFLLSTQSGLAQLDTEKVPAKPNPARGGDLAERWCSSCHVVSKTQTKGTDSVPSFASIARRADLNVEKLAFFLLHPHPVMPNMALSRDDARDLAAYIETQR